MQPHTIKPRPQHSLENKPVPQSHRNYCEKHNGTAEPPSPSGTPYDHKETLLTLPAQSIMARLTHVHIREPHLFPIADPSLLKGGGGGGGAVLQCLWKRDTAVVLTCPRHRRKHSGIHWFREPLTRAVGRDKSPEMNQWTPCLSGREGATPNTEKKRRQSALINFPQGCTRSHLNKTNDLICREELETWANKPWHEAPS